jgi:hypothetical protein
LAFFGWNDRQSFWPPPIVLGVCSKREAVRFSGDQTTASLTMTFQIERRRVSTTSALWIALSLVVLSLPNVCWAISQACYNETAALAANEKIQIAYEKYAGDGGCDFNSTHEVCSFDYSNSNSSVYEKVCFDAGGVFYTYDYTAECPADSTDENSTALYVHNWYEPDCLGKSCTTDEALVIFRSANINCTFNASYINPNPYPSKPPTPTKSPTKVDVPTPTKVDIPVPTQADVPAPTMADIPAPTKADIPAPTKADVPPPTKADVPAPTNEVSGIWSRYSSWWAMTTLSALVAVASVAL